MVKQNYKLSILVLAAGLVATPPVYAADAGGWFFGIQPVRSELKLKLPGVDSPVQADNAYRLSAGYQFTSNLKAEFNYLDLSRPTLTTNALGLPVSQAGKGKGLQVAGTASLPVTEKFGLYGRLGAFHSNLESSCANSLLTCAAAERGTDVNYGLGMRYDFTKTVSVGGEWERFHRFGGRNTTGDSDKDFFSVGLGFKF